MDKIKELTDFYMWMQENDYNHNIRSRVEKKAEMYLSNINAGQKLPIYNVSDSSFKIGTTVDKSKAHTYLDSD